MKSIFVIEDNNILRENYKELLTEEGFSVHAFSNGKDALEQIRRSLPDLVLLDITLGDERDAGFHICHELRKLSDMLPIVFFTEHENLSDKISGMRLGADDYITKDIPLEYLIVRIKALLKRLEILTSAETSSKKRIARGHLTISPDELKVVWKGVPLDFTLTQFWMVWSLARHPGQVKTHEQLKQAANIEVEMNTIAAHIKNIRRAFNRIDRSFSCIKTERGAGYRWISN
ncbi:MAG: response regulator [Pseudomonadota bacterium]